MDARVGGSDGRLQGERDLGHQPDEAACVGFCFGGEFPDVGVDGGDVGVVEVWVVGGRGGCGYGGEGEVG